MNHPKPGLDKRPQFTDEEVLLFHSEGRQGKIEIVATTLEDMVTKLASAPLYFPPGTNWQYSVAIDVLGYLVEVLSGKPLDAYFRERLFEPLGMNDTGFFVPARQMARFTNVYNYTEEGGLVPLKCSTLVVRL